MGEHVLRADRIEWGDLVGGDGLELCQSAPLGGRRSSGGGGRGSIVANRDSEDYAEVAFLQINTSKPPFDDVRIRRAMAMSIE